MVMRITDKQIEQAILQGRKHFWAAARYQEFNGPPKNPEEIQKRGMTLWDSLFKRTDITPKNEEELDKYWLQGYTDEYNKYLADQRPDPQGDAIAKQINDLFEELI